MNHMPDNIIHSGLYETNKLLRTLVKERRADLTEQLEDLYELLRQAHVVQRFQTYDLILQALNDVIFMQLDVSQTNYLKRRNLKYISKMLKPRQELDNESVNVLAYALSALPQARLDAAMALLPLHSDMKTGSFWCNVDEYPRAPTIAEAIMIIKSSDFQLTHKRVLIDYLDENLESSKGNPLFLPSSCKSSVTQLQEKIRRVELKLAALEVTSHET
ncbi:hypothetical protein GALMADRAFT_688413 [Galerina marginata CBS 339.88]|uniref:Uncharacterized protein n=1 Tax=Galerina marginata (strain CBS 339.88) TaxID=685588 RepID=A0A067TLH1_GALM3|nr:hypothetical protein GALMADRAFT_688413 [Galerina marginata CBS 339.88]